MVAIRGHSIPSRDDDRLGRYAADAGPVIGRLIYLFEIIDEYQVPLAPSGRRAGPGRLRVAAVRRTAAGAEFEA